MTLFRHKVILSIHHSLHPLINVLLDFLANFSFPPCPSIRELLLSILHRFHNLLLMLGPGQCHLFPRLANEDSKLLFSTNDSLLDRPCCVTWCDCCSWLTSWWREAISWSLWFESEVRCCSFSTSACSRAKISRSLFANVKRCPLTIESLLLDLRNDNLKIKNRNAHFLKACE